MLTRALTRTRIRAAILAALLFVAGYGTGRGSTPPDHELALVGEAYQRIRDLAARSPAEGRLSREAIAGMLRALEDSYAEYLPVATGDDAGDDLEHRVLGLQVAGLSEAAGLEGRVLEPGIGYLRVALFSPGAGMLARAELERMRALGVRGVILDLRGNPGGLVDDAVDLAGALVGDEVVFRYQTAAGGAGERVGTGSRVPGLTLVVLVDGQTASAAELVAGAVQDHGRGLVVGERTKGKATVQRVVRLSDGSAIKLTTASYRTPSGRGVDATGIRPDVRVAAGPQDRALERARSILRAIAGG